MKEYEVMWVTPIYESMSDEAMNMIQLVILPYAI